MKEYDEIKDTASTVAEDSEPKANQEKRVNPTWEAFQKYKGAFEIIDPSFLE